MFSPTPSLLKYCAIITFIKTASDDPKKVENGPTRASQMSETLILMSKLQSQQEMRYIFKTKE